jgi:antitoxin YobK
MDVETFRQEFDQLREQDPFLFEGHDPEAIESELEDAQSRLGCRFGPKYAQFLREYGGGDVGSCMVYSVHPGSHWNIVDRNLARDWLPRNLLDFSPNGTGDHYLFPIENGIAGDKVLFYDHETGSLVESGYNDILEYVLENCH